MVTHFEEGQISVVQNTFHVKWTSILYLKSPKYLLKTTLRILEKLPLFIDGRFFLCFLLYYFNSYSSMFGEVVNLCNGKDEGTLLCFLACFSHDHDHSNSLACWGHAGEGGNQSGGFNTKNIGLYSHSSFFIIFISFTYSTW